MIRITVPGMPNRELSVEEDTAECIFEALAEVLGADTQYGWTEKEDEAEQGSVTVTRI